MILRVLAPCIFSCAKAVCTRCAGALLWFMWIPQGGGGGGCIRWEGASQPAPEAVQKGAGGGCQSGWGRLLSVTNAIEAGIWRQGASGHRLGMSRRWLFDGKGVRWALGRTAPAHPDPLSASGALHSNPLPYRCTPRALRSNVGGSGGMGADRLRFRAPSADGGRPSAIASDRAAGSARTAPALPSSATAAYAFEARRAAFPRRLGRSRYPFGPTIDRSRAPRDACDPDRSRWVCVAGPPRGVLAPARGGMSTRSRADNAGPASRGVKGQGLAVARVRARMGSVVEGADAKEVMEPLRSMGRGGNSDFCFARSSASMMAAFLLFGALMSITTTLLLLLLWGVRGVCGRDDDGVCRRQRDALEEGRGGGLEPQR